MRNAIRILLAPAFALASATALWAGGLFVVLGNPEANPEARGEKAVLTLQLAGCNEPQNAVVTGVAISVTGGREQSIPLQLKALAKRGTYAITRQWPDQGRWVLEFIAKDQGRVTSTLVVAGSGGIERQAAKMEMREPARSEVLAMLEERKAE
jgi:hypothetical protein